MPAKSRKQQQMFAIAEHTPEKLYAENKPVLKMSHSQLRDFAATPRKGLPLSASKAPRRIPRTARMSKNMKGYHSGGEIMANHDAHDQAHMKHVDKQLEKCGIC